MAKKAAAQNGRADLPVSQDARLVASKQSGDGQRVPTTKKENSLGGASVPASRSPDAKTAREDSRPTKLKPSSLLDTPVVYCGDNLEQLKKLPDGCVDFAYIDPPFNSNRNYELASPARTWGETKEKRAFEDRHENTKAYPATVGRQRCVQLARVLKKTGSFYYHCD